MTVSMNRSGNVLTGITGNEEVRQVGGGGWRWRALKVRRSILKQMRCFDWELMERLKNA